MLLAKFGSLSSLLFWCKEKKEKTLSEKQVM